MGPVCPICLAPPPAQPAGAWRCPFYGSAGPSFCAACVARHAAVSLESSHSVACPRPGCSHALPTPLLAATLGGPEGAPLLPLAALAAARERRHAAQAAHLAEAKAAAGAGAGLLGAPCGTVRPCPDCKALAVKDGGCSHVCCASCGTCWDWDTGWVR